MFGSRQRIMIGLMQRVNQASVRVDGECVGAVERGLLVLVGVERNDDAQRVDRLLERILGYRVFPDDSGRMNLSVRDIQGGVLLVPQFTLAADTRKGTRASFTSAAPPELGRQLFTYLAEQAIRSHPRVELGRFGADMQVALINDGPVTFWVQA